LAIFTVFEQPKTPSASRFVRFIFLFSVCSKRWIRFVAPKEYLQRFFSPFFEQPKTQSASRFVQGSTKPPRFIFFFFCAQQKVDSICRIKRIFAKKDSLGSPSAFFEQPNTHSASRLARFIFLFCVRSKRIRFVVPKEYLQRQMHLAIFTAF
jgi:hypothetical protein